MNWKQFGRKWLWPISPTVVEFFLRNWGNPKNPLLGGVPDDIWKEYLPNTSLDFITTWAWLRVLLEKLKVLSKSRNSLLFMELENHCFFLKWLPLIQIWVSSDPFHTPTPVYYLKMHFNIILSSAYSSYKWSLFVRFKPHLSCVFYVPLLQFLILITCGREYALQSYSLCHFLRPPFIKLLMVHCKLKIISILRKMFFKFNHWPPQ